MPAPAKLLHHTAEARSFVALVKSGRATVEQVRAQIGHDTVERRKVLLGFDALREDLTPELRATVINLLRKHSLRFVRVKLGLPHKIILKISREAHAPFKKIGRGRRFSIEQRQEILIRIRADARSIDIQREFGVSDWLVQKLRHSIGDFENRLLRRSWDIEKVKEALRAGLSVTEIERTHGIQHAVLWKLRKRLGDVEDRRGRHRRILSDSERAAILFDIRHGLYQSSIARKYHLHTRRVHALQVEAGRPPHYRHFTTDEILQIEARLREGYADAEIAHQLNCHRATIWFRRKKLRGAS